MYTLITKYISYIQSKTEILRESLQNLSKQYPFPYIAAPNLTSIPYHFSEAQPSSRSISSAHCAQKSRSPRTKAPPSRLICLFASSPSRSPDIHLWPAAPVSRRARLRGGPVTALSNQVRRAASARHCAHTRVRGIQSPRCAIPRRQLLRPFERAIDSP